jgi:hypothetical protein
MRWRYKLLVGLATVATAVGLFLWWVEPPAPPPLLQRVSAAGGWWGACPPEVYEKRLALSPELNQRLAEQFPPGTTEEDLLRGLATQGFLGIEHCRGDDTIRWTMFENHAMRAAVYWKAHEGKIVWTKGFVFHIFL